jgi:uncharacterized protein YbjT (DUF2867 family)
MRRRVGIIGASGTAGSAIASFLESKGEFDVIRFTRKKSVGEQFQFFNFKSENWNDLGHLDILVNCAGILRESRTEDFYQVHVELVKTLLANRYRIGNPAIIHLSALGADSDHQIAFLKTKGIGDELLLGNPETYILRPSIICLPKNILVQKFKWLVFMTRVLANRPIVPKGFLETRVQPVMGADLAESVYALCNGKSNERIIPVVGKQPLSFKELLQYSSKLNEKTFFPIEIPKKLMEPVTKNFISVWFPELINQDQFSLLFKDNVASPALMESLIGRDAQSSLDFWDQEFREIKINSLF